MSYLILGVNTGFFAGAALSAATGGAASSLAVGIAAAGVVVSMLSVAVLGPARS